MGTAFIVKRHDRAAAEVVPGETVYRCTGHDYGCANDDTIVTGIRHISVTKDANGEYPFFTIPEDDLEAVEA